MQRDLIDELQGRIETLWAKTDLGSAVTVRRERQDDGSSHVEFVDGHYDIVATERGSETERTAGLSLSDAARWYVFDMAVGHALAAEVKNRRVPKNPSPMHHGLTDDGYSRWNWMAPAIETMGRISPEHAAWARAYYVTTLRDAPLKDYEKRNAQWPLLPEIE